MALLALKVQICKVTSRKWPYGRGIIILLFWYIITVIITAKHADHQSHHWQVFTHLNNIVNHETH